MKHESDQLLKHFLKALYKLPLIDSGDIKPTYKVSCREHQEKQGPHRSTCQHRQNKYNTYKISTHFQVLFELPENACSLESHWNYKLYPGLSFESLLKQLCFPQCILCWLQMLEKNTYTFPFYFFSFSSLLSKSVVNICDNTKKKYSTLWKL